MSRAFSECLYCADSHWGPCKVVSIHNTTSSRSIVPAPKKEGTDQPSQQPTSGFDSLTWRKFRPFAKSRAIFVSRNPTVTPYQAHNNHNTTRLHNSAPKPFSIRKPMSLKLEEADPVTLEPQIHTSSSIVKLHKVDGRTPSCRKFEPRDALYKPFTETAADVKSLTTYYINTYDGTSSSVIREVDRSRILINLASSVSKNAVNRLSVGIYMGEDSPWNFAHLMPLTYPQTIEFGEVWVLSLTLKLALSVRSPLQEFSKFVLKVPTRLSIFAKDVLLDQEDPVMSTEQETAKVRLAKSVHELIVALEGNGKVVKFWRSTYAQDSRAYNLAYCADEDGKACDWADFVLGQEAQDTNDASRLGTQKVQRIIVGDTKSSSTLEAISGSDKKSSGQPFQLRNQDTQRKEPTKSSKMLSQRNTGSILPAMPLPTNSACPVPSRTIMNFIRSHDAPHYVDALMGVCKHCGERFPNARIRMEHQRTCKELPSNKIHENATAVEAISSEPPDLSSAAEPVRKSTSQTQMTGLIHQTSGLQGTVSEVQQSSSCYSQTAINIPQDQRTIRNETSTTSATLDLKHRQLLHKSEGRTLNSHTYELGNKQATRGKNDVTESLKFGFSRKSTSLQTPDGYNIQQESFDGAIGDSADGKENEKKRKNIVDAARAVKPTKKSKIEIARPPPPKLMTPAGTRYNKLPATESKHKVFVVLDHSDDDKSRTVYKPESLSQDDPISSIEPPEKNPLRRPPSKWQVRQARVLNKTRSEIPETAEPETPSPSLDCNAPVPNSLRGLACEYDEYSLSGESDKESDEETHLAEYLTRMMTDNYDKCSVNLGSTKEVDEASDLGSIAELDEESYEEWHEESDEDEDMESEEDEEKAVEESGAQTQAIEQVAASGYRHYPSRLSPKDQDVKADVIENEASNSGRYRKREIHQDLSTKTVYKDLSIRNTRVQPDKRRVVLGQPTPGFYVHLPIRPTFSEASEECQALLEKMEGNKVSLRKMLAKGSLIR